VYVVSLRPSTGENADGSSKPALQPATEPLPLSATKVVVRFPDPRANLNDAVRVENEVAAMVLAHDALKPLGRSIVPAVYGWSSAAAGGTGWVLMECMPGTRLDLAGFKKLGRDAKKAVLGEIARVLRLLQQYKLPASVEGYGGLGFAEDGTIAVGPTAIYGATKRCETYHELYTECVSSPLFVIVNSSSKAAVAYSLRGNDTGIFRRSLPSWISETSCRAGKTQTCGRGLMSLLREGSSRYLSGPRT
jgi:hypothetical protein